MTEKEKAPQHFNYAVANVLAGNCTCKEKGTCNWCVIYYADDSVLGGIILSRLREEQATLQSLRQTNKRLNRRCQRAESTARENIEICEKQGFSLGRSLANFSASDYRRRFEHEHELTKHLKTLLSTIENITAVIPGEGCHQLLRQVNCEAAKAKNYA